MRESISRYAIEKQLGQGGMGSVYLARDTQLGRQVAIKMLAGPLAKDEKARNLLMREAQAAAALEHPAICGVFEVVEEDGEYFVVMPYLEGETLDARLKAGKLGVREAVKIAVQVAGALDAAHARGIVHRDVKPQNVMLLPTGGAKLMDFGVAAFAGPNVVHDDAALLSTREIGTMIGTVLYMSPEQVNNESPDGRSDVFSFGSMLYEMVTGRQAFAGPTVAATVSNILMNPPAPLELPAVPELERIIRKCVEKPRDRRYQTMGDLVRDLESLLETMPEQTGKHAVRRGLTSRMWIGAGALGVAAIAAGAWWIAANRAPETRTIAVLPFPTTDGWGDAFAASLAGRMGFLDNLRVVSYSRSADFAGRDPLTAAKELGVDAVLTGRAIREGGRTALELKLIDARRGQDRWKAGRLEVGDPETGQLEKRVAEQVKQALGLTVTAKDLLVLSRAGRANGQAYNWFLRGWRQLSGPAEDGAARALPLLAEALKLDPKYPDALGAAGLAKAREFVAGRVDQAALESAQAGVNQTLELDADNVLALRARVEIEQSLGRARAAIAAARRLAAAAGNDVDALLGASSAYFRAGLLDQAVEAGERAAALDPARADVRILASRSYYGLGNYRKGLEVLQPVLGRNHGAEWMALLHYTELKQYDEAAQAGAQHLARRQTEFNVWFDLGRAYALAGKDGQAQATWREGARHAEVQLAKVDNPRNRLWLARLYAALGEKDKADKDRAKEQLAKVKSDDPWTLFQAAAAYGSLGDKAGLLQNLEAAAGRGFLSIQYLDANLRQGMPLAAYAADADVKAVRDRVAGEVEKLRQSLR